MKQIRIKKILKITGIVVLIMVILIAGCIYGLWHNEISTLSSIEMLRDRNDEHSDGAIYRMNVKGDFYLDDFVEQGGVSNDGELIQFVTDH